MTSARKFDNDKSAPHFTSFQIQAKCTIRQPVYFYYLGSIIDFYAKPENIRSSVVNTETVLPLSVVDIPYLNLKLKRKH